MKVLYSSAEVHSQIKKILSFPMKGERRVIIVAYIGKEAEAFLPNVEGLEIVCSLTPGATSAETLVRLQSRGAKISKSKRLHMKVYWSSKKGCVICSANASKNALGQSALKEAGVYINVGVVDLKQLFSYVKPQTIRSKDLDILKKESDAWKIATADFKVRKDNDIPQNFLQWYDGKWRGKWQLGWWEENTLEIAESVKAKSKLLYSRTEPYFILNFEKGVDLEGQWILCFKLPTGNTVSWMYIDFVEKVSPKNLRAYERNFPYQAAQVHANSFYPTPPFKINDSFRTALKIAVLEYGAENISNSASLYPPNSLLKLIRQFYKQGRDV